VDRDCDRRVTGGGWPLKEGRRVACGMSGLKRGRCNTPVAVLEYLQQVLCAHDYEELQQCVFEHDRHLQKTQKLSKKHCSAAFLYTQSCAAIFQDLQDTIFVQYEYLHAMERLVDVSRLVDGLISHEFSLPGGGAGGSGGGGGGGLFNAAPNADDAPDSVAQATACLQQGAVAIVKRSNKLLRQAHEDITDANSQLRFSLRYKTLARILDLARGSSESAHEQEDEEEDDQTTKQTPDSVVEAVVKSTHVYDSVKNKCLLGAVIKYTERSRKKLARERSENKINGQCVVSACQIATIERDLMTKVGAMLQSSHGRGGGMKQKIALVVAKTKHDNVLLQQELDGVKKQIALCSPPA